MVIYFHQDDIKQLAMIQPNELKLNLPMKIANGVMSTTTKVWEILVASKEGNIEKVKKLIDECPELIYAQYNYTPPIHFAVREGHKVLVKYLLANGANDPGYKFYPFQENLQTIANDKGLKEIESLLDQYLSDPAMHKFRGDNGEIFYNRTELELEFQKIVDEENLERTEEILKQHPEFAKDETFFWGEGILLFAVKENNRKMIDLLMSYGAKVPDILKWTQFYYFERLDGATYIMEKGMNPNTMSWQHVTILHDMAQKGFIDKAELLIKHGADINPIDEEYKSTPLGMAVRWGHVEMIKYLLSKNADVNKAGAAWATPLAWAKKKGHTAIEKILTDAGAK
jgi:ankyrin repeat protein